jgi:dipeptidyl aminopeptidase/acylaminoacyl peptidase
MVPPRYLLTGLIMLAGSAAGALEPLPVEDFAREPATNRASLSPDGKRLAFLREHGERSTLHVAEIDESKLSRLDMGEAVVRNGARKEVSAFSWVGDRRLVITTTVWDAFYGVVAVNADGGQWVPISGYENNKGQLRSMVGGVSTYSMDSALRETVHAFYDADASILMLDRHELTGGSANRPDLMKVNTVIGTVYTELKNPGEVARWGLDFDGVARLGILSHGELSGAIYREREQAPWRTVLPLENRRGGIRPLGFEAASNRIFVAALNPERRWAIFLLDPATGSLGAPVLSNAEYDIAPEKPGEVAGLSLATPIFSRKKQTLLGIRYYTEAPRVKWLDKEFAGHQLAINRAMPDTVNLLAGTSADETRLLWFAFSDQNPGEYFLMDVAQHKLKQLAPRMSWIKPAQMAPMLAVKYSARDGLLIHGYLTLPVGHEAKDLPLVVLVHGGPWARDSWGFDPLVQLLANRGYAVLQMNYRGSTGYGDELYQKARRQIGREIQNDIEDATRWAIASGLADAKRIAIMGASYGGYSALFGLGHNPELYRCGISLFGVTDWLAFFEKSDIADYKTAKRYWREQLGDPEKDQVDLKAISPVNFADQITAPVLIVQGKEDQRVPPDQAKRMIAALTKAGRKPESLFISNLGHTYGNEKQRTEIYKSVVTFLEKNLGPGVR